MQRNLGNNFSQLEGMFMIGIDFNIASCLYVKEEDWTVSRTNIEAELPSKHLWLANFCNQSFLF